MIEGQVDPPELVAGVFPDPAADVLAVPVLTGDDGPLLGPGAAELLENDDLDLFAALDAEQATGRAGEITAVPYDGRVLLLLGVGDATSGDLRRAGAALGRRTKDADLVGTSAHLAGDDAGARAFIEGIVLGSFTYSLRSAGPTSRPPARVVLPVADDVLALAVAVARAGWLSRTLATVPSNIKYPQWFVDQATPLARDVGLKVEVYDDDRLRRDGFGGIVAVGQGSATPPRLMRLTYTPSGRGSRKAPHLVLAGKGITFDSGGLSIKTGEGMVTMKRDMTGAAVVLACMTALADVGCPLRVTALLPLAENMVGATSMRPGDVITHYGGRTTEVTNTDAEGRLVLADALAYAVAELEPDLLVDVATLTGAMKVAMGLHLGGMFATVDGLADQLVVSGEAAGEPLWRMPLSDLYEDRLASKVADADNAPGSAQAITAALFLQHFTGGLPWAHLDLAPVGDAPKDDAEWTEGPTGFGARALLYWLEQAEPLAGVL